MNGFFNDTAPTEIYTLSLHDALPIWTASAASDEPRGRKTRCSRTAVLGCARWCRRAGPDRSEEHTCELQSRPYLVWRLLLSKKQYGPRRMNSRRGSRSRRADDLMTPL